MPLEVFAYVPTEDPSVEEDQKWKRRAIVYPGEEIQIPSLTADGRFKMMRVKVKPDDSLSTIHVIYPMEIRIRGKNSEIPSQVLFDDNQTENLPAVIRKGESFEVFTRLPATSGKGKLSITVTRGKLVQR